MGQSQAPGTLGGTSELLGLLGLLVWAAGPSQVLRINALGQGQRLRLAVHAQPAVVAAEAAVVLVLGWLPLSQEAQRRPRARRHLGVALGREACEGQAVEELGARVLGLRPRDPPLGVLAPPRRSLHVVHLQDIGRTAA